MKAVIVGRKNEFSPTTGSGIPRYMWELFTNLKDIADGSIEKREYLSLPYIDRHLPFTNNFTFMFRTAFSTFGKYDLVHNPDPSNMIPDNSIKKTTFVTTVHDFIPILHTKAEVYSQDIKISKFKLLLLKLNLSLNNYMTAVGMRNALHQSDGLIADSSQTKEEAQALGYKKRIYIVNLGLDSRFITERSTYHDGRFRVGYIGGLGPRKNVNFIFRAWKLLDKEQNMELNIWGNKTVESTAIFNYLGGDSHIKINGFAPEKDLIHIYDSFDVFVFPSLYEGFGLPILEAQSRGLPVIIYKAGRIPKEVRRYCFEAKNEEHLAQIILELKKNGYNTEQKKRAIEYARSFTWRKTAEKTLEAYNKILTS
jgi:glycosyltransferase involved in cell wall biosynthesis